MKRIYENFSEIARDFTDGDNWTHQLSDHKADDCFAWQHGVREFAQWLDAYGLKLVENSEAWKVLWDGIADMKPIIFSKCSKKE